LKLMQLVIVLVSPLVPVHGTSPKIPGVPEEKGCF
jgi:hypothetical protein